MGCPECNAMMEPGFIPDLANSEVRQSVWHRGASEARKIFGMKKGVKYHETETVEVTTYRCTACGLLKSFAFSED